jgi:hypothetical protein
MKKSKELERVHSHLEKSIEILSIILEKREESFESKSEKWQESQQGEEFADETQTLDAIKDYIQDQIDELENLFND